MKTIKRTLSAALIACLLLSLLVPTALAASTTEVVKEVKYDFKYLNPVFNVTSGSKNLAKLDNDGNGIPNDNYETLNDAYGNTVNSAVYYWSTTYAKAVPTITTNGIYLNANVGDWIAIKIKSPGDGSFTVKVQPKSVSTAPTKCNVYLLPGNTAEEDISSSLTSPIKTGLTLYTNSAKTISSTCTFEKGEDYLIVFKSTEGASGSTFQLQNLQITKTCTDAADAANQISNAPLGSTITLQDDCNAAGENITVGAGVTLNLNGKTLTASSVTGFKGSIVTDSGDAAATLKVDELKLQKDDTYIPLYDTVNSCYKLYNYTLQSLTPESNKYWFRLTFTSSAAYDLIASGTSGLEIGVDMSWTVGSVAGGTYAGAKANDFDYSGWANAVKENSKVAISVTVTGIELVDAGSFELVPTITSSAVDAA